MSDISRLISSHRICPIGAQLGTGYSQFKSTTGIEGLAKWSGGTIEILAVYASAPGRGEFRAFIKIAKTMFSEIYVWEVWNEKLALVLERYGFKTVTRSEPNGETVSGYVWTAPLTFPVFNSTVVNDDNIKPLEKPGEKAPEESHDP